MPGIPLMKRTILRVRKRENASPGIPQSLYDLVIPEDYKKTSDGKSFLLYDSFDHDPDNCYSFYYFPRKKICRKCPNAIVGMQMAHFHVPHLFLNNYILFMEYNLQTSYLRFMHSYQIKKRKHIFVYCKA